MNVLFLSLGRFESINQYSLYTDLLRQFAINGHKVYVITPREKRHNLPTEILKEKNTEILKLRIGNITKTNLIEKGLSTIFIEMEYIEAIKKYFSRVKFDLVLYTTPPITLANAIDYVKKRDGAKTYLLLKDIFPQNAIDLGILKKSGMKKVIYLYFRFKEKRLYALSDYIGCMSEANCQFVRQNNRTVSPECVEVCPNSIEVRDFRIDEGEKQKIRIKYGLPKDKKIFVYGGNLGKPQGIPFLIECLKVSEKIEESYFLIVGDGTEYKTLLNAIQVNSLTNVKLISRMNKEDYDRMIAACDIGLIFLDNRFTIPNFPSRMLSYMQVGLPIFACTDKNTDIGNIIVEGQFGWWCESNDVGCVKKYVKEICAMPKEEIECMKRTSYEYLCKNYSVEKSYKIIMNSLKIKETANENIDNWIF